MTYSVTRLLPIALLALCGLSACSPGVENGSQAFGVENAYRMPNAVVVQPYTRTIFSSNNF